MRAQTMSELLCGFAREAQASERDAVVVENPFIRRSAEFAAERFAAGQIRGLIRQVFSSGVTPAIRQVVFSGIDAEADVGGVCRKVGETLAAETGKDVVLITSGAPPELDRGTEPFQGMRKAAKHVDGKLWSLELSNESSHIVGSSLVAYFKEVRREFEYSIVAASAGVADEAVVMGQAADGIILVLSALRTRRAAALRFREALGSARLLGTILTDREFPIPSAIYRRL
jgi:hypothetical protein